MHSRTAPGTIHAISVHKAGLFSWRLRARQFVGSSALRRLGDSAPRWPAGSPAQWQRPRMWICVGPRDPATKPSRGWLWVVVRKPRLVLVEIASARSKVTAKARAYVRGGVGIPPCGQEERWAAPMVCVCLAFLARGGAYHHPPRAARSPMAGQFLLVLVGASCQRGASELGGGRSRRKTEPRAPGRSPAGLVGSMARR